MKALILNSGLGSRMGGVTAEHPKCMTDISSKETIISRQLRQIYDVGIEEVIITTGLFSDKLQTYCEGLGLPLNIKYVYNEKYQDTNYIYSIYLAREYLCGDIILMHGDLVFEDTVLEQVVNSNISCMAVSSCAILSEKDFKASVSNDRITKIGIDFFESVYPAQPLYKLRELEWKVWLSKIIGYCEKESGQKRKCYAEDAFNEISGQCAIYPLDIQNRFCCEIDNPSDLERAVRKLQVIENRTVYMAFSSSIIHGGHIAIIKKARKLGKLLVGVMSDDAIAGFQRKPILPFEDRKELFQNICGVNKVVRQDSLSYKSVIEKYRPDYVVHGSDWSKGAQRAIRREVIDLLNAYGGELIEFPYNYDPRYAAIDDGSIKLLAPQKILSSDDHYAELDVYLKENGFVRPLLVCGKSAKKLKVYEHIKSSFRSCVRFSGFASNPVYDSVVLGVNKFREENCDSIIAVGGGSAIDVAKCIKLFATMNPDLSFLAQEIVPNNIKLVVIPTTAGTGSEVTKYAVIYYNNMKQSITSEGALPNAVMFDYMVLQTLPFYQRKATAFDALCHAIESYWSVNSTDESRKYSREAIRLILNNMESYFSGQCDDKTIFRNMLHASYLAGKAINITQTTAAHAMCYKLTEILGIAHGHAAALCLAEVWPFMLKDSGQIADQRGKSYIADMFHELSEAFTGQCPERFGSELFCAAMAFREMLKAYGLYGWAGAVGGIDMDELAASVNPERLKNNPVALRGGDIIGMYRNILDALGTSMG